MSTMNKTTFFKQFFFLHPVFLLTCSLTVQAALLAQTPVNQEHKLERGGKVSVNNHNGSISIRGWDKDVIEATATGKGQAEPSPVKISEDRPGMLSITADGERGRHEKRLEIKLPLYAEIESASAHNGDIDVTDIEGAVKVSSGSGDLRFTRVGPLTATTGSGDVQADQVAGQTSVSTGSGDISLSHVGPLEVRAGSGDISLSDIKGAAKVQTGSGDVTAKDIGGDFIAKLSSGDLELDRVTGLVNVSVTSGNAQVHHGGSDVRINSISGDISVQCVKGHVELNSASGSMNLFDIGDDVDATTTSGDVKFASKIRTGGRYRLKSTSGHTHMTVPADAPGFTATLSSYSGEVETDFPLTVESPLQGPVNRRIIGRYGDGQAQIQLDSFSTGVKLSKASAGVIKDCP
jgi:DUF4097 and DUF4098 domain-containing protein YvlB